MAETKTELTYADTVRLCMNTLAEKFQDNRTGNNILFTVFSDGDTVDCAILGSEADIINVLCNCCSANDDILRLLTKTVVTMI